MPTLNVEGLSGFCLTVVVIEGVGNTFLKSATTERSVVHKRFRPPICSLLVVLLPTPFPLLLCLCGGLSSSFNPTPWTIKAADPLAPRDLANNNRYLHPPLTQNPPFAQPTATTSPIRATSPSITRSVGHAMAL